MFGPTRVFTALGRNDDAGVIAGIASVSAMFAATPFLIPAIVDEYGVRLGAAGLLSTAQVASFALVVFLAGRNLRTRRRYLIGAALLSMAMNLLSAVAPSFAVLVALRMVAGGAAGIMVWLSWAKAMRMAGSMRNVAAAGPLTVFISAPVLGWLASDGGTVPVFLTLAVVSVPAVFLPADFAGFRAERRRMSPSRSNLVLVAAMGLSTLFGSALFVYAATVGRDLGAGPLVVSAAFSFNALGGFVASRIAGPGSGGEWILGTALCVAAVGFSSSQMLFFAGLTMWGFCFWMSTPRILASISAWSLAPDERVGDTQSAMAVGRAIGPAVGGALIGDGSYGAVTTVAVVGLVVAALAVILVRRYRLDRISPRVASSPPG